MAGDQAGKDLLDMDERMFAAKEGIDNLHQEIAEYFCPHLASFTGEITLGEEFASHLIDFYPALVSRELKDQIGSMVRPSDRQWNKATVDNKDIKRDRASSDYLEFMTEVNRGILQSRDSGFRRAAKEHEGFWSDFGIASLQVSYTKDRSNLQYRSHHLKDCAFAEGPDGEIDHHHRKCDMKARTMLHHFGESRLPQKVKDALKKKDDKTDFKVRHIFIPIDKYEPHRKFPKWAKWADIYVADDGTILQEMPSATFDYVVSRWMTLPGKVYSFSPATIIALPQARMIQRMMLTLIEAGEKRVDPPLMAFEDAITSPVDLGSGRITYMDAEFAEARHAPLQALDLGKDVGLGENLLVDARQLLADAFFINKLQPLAATDRDKTAYEASQLVQEYIRSALPLFEPVEDEWTGRVLDLSTAKVMRAGGYGPVDANGVPEDMPDALLGQNITHEFNNSLKEARDRQTIQGYQESMMLLQAAAAVDNSAATEVDLRTSFRDAFGAVPGTRADWLVDSEEAMQARAQMQQAMQAQQMMQEVGQGAEVAGSVGEALQAFEGLA